MSGVTELRNAIRAFKAWAEQRFPAGERHGEWETEYENWSAIETAFNACLDGYTPEQWTEEIVELLLYALARDNETQRLQNALKLRQSHLIALARASCSSTDNDARWQLADALRDRDIAPGMAEPVLEQLFDGGNEYVSRRALIALGDRGSAKAEALALRAWETGDEYQRMAALGALRSINSSAFGRYLALAMEDGREHLTDYATRLLPSGGHRTS